MIMDFSQKNVLITGGSRGIGRACAKLFSELNAHVIITYKTQAREAALTLELLKKGGNHRSYQLDISNPAGIESFYNTLMGDYAQLDVLVNNAGVYIEHKLNEVGFEAWHKSWDETLMTNLSGVAHLCYFAAKDMIRLGGGKIVNVSSRGAFRGEPNHPAYGASKAGLNSFSQSLAQYLAPYNVTVGVVAPGFVETDMAAEILRSDAGPGVINQSPLKRVASPDEVARIIAVFASQGFEYMTGGIIDINGASYLRT